MSTETKLRQSAEQAGRDIHSTVGATAAHIAEVAADKVETAIETAEQAARRVSAQASEAGDRVKEVAGNMRHAVDKSLNDQPMTTLLLAAAAGFILGALWKA